MHPVALSSALAITLIVIAFTSFESADGVLQRRIIVKKIRRLKPTRMATRRAIVRCCGRKSCVSAVRKRNRTATVHTRSRKTTQDDAVGEVTLKGLASTQPEEAATEGGDATQQSAPPDTDPPSNEITPTAAESEAATAVEEAPPTSEISDTGATTPAELATTSGTEADTISAVGSSTASSSSLAASTNQIISATSSASSAISFSASTTLSSFAATSTSASTAAGTNATSASPTASLPSSIASSTMTSTATSTTTTTTTTTTTPQHHECGKFYVPHKKNESLFLNGKLKDPTIYGNWHEGAGNIYLFGFSLVSWAENVRMCVNLDMTPIRLDSLTVKTALDTLAKNTTWKGPQHYWTAGRKSENASWAGKFQWCSANESTALLTEHVRWGWGQPDNLGGQQNCIHLKIDTKIPQHEITDRNCTAKLPFACQDALFMDTVTYANQYTPFIDSNAHGIWRLVNARYFLFPTEKLTWDAAYKKCCSLGMKLLSLDVEHKYASAIKAISDTSAPAPSPGTFWTSGTDQGCFGSFVWCSARKMFYNSKWAASQPAAASAQAQCVTVKVDAQTALLETADCALTKNFICEALDTRDTPTSGRALQKECAENFNISMDVLDKVMNLSVTDMTVQLKCFLKCIGEISNTWTYGGLNMETVLMLIEATSENDEQKMQTSIDALDVCSQIKGVDECDTAARVMECGKNALPDAFDELVTAVDFATMEDVPINRTKPKCRTFHLNILNPAKRQKWLTSTVTAFEGDILTACGRKYLFSYNDLSYDAAAAFCYSFGLQMITFETAWEENCLNDMFYDSTYYVGWMYSWVSASKWATPDGRSIWCPSGDYFLANASLYPPPLGNTNPFNHLLGAAMGKQFVGVKKFSYEARNPTNLGRVLCEEF